MDHPNPQQTKNQFLELTWTYKKLMGEAFWYVVRGATTNRPKAFYNLRPDYMNVVLGVDEFGGTAVTGYVFEAEDGVKVPMTMEEVVHFKEPNPKNPFRGMGAVEAGLTYISTEKNASEFTRNFIVNNAMPAGIVNIKGAIEQREFEKIKRAWNNEYGNVSNAGKTAFLKQSEVEFVKVGATLGDIDLKALKDITRTDIMMMFGVTKPIIGILDDVNLASAKAAEYIFMKQIIDPEMDQLTDTIEPLLYAWDKTLDLEYTNVVPTDELSQKLYYEAAVNKWMTPNEIRQEIGLPPLAGGDVIQTQGITTPTASEMQMKKVESPTIRVKTTTVVKEMTQPIVVETTPEEVQEEIQQAEPQPDVVSEQTMSDMPYEAKEAFRSDVQDRVESYIRQVRGRINIVLDEQKKEVVGNLPGTTKAIGNNLFDEQQQTEKFIEKLSPVMFELMKTQGTIALRFAGEEKLNFELIAALKEAVNESIRRAFRDFNRESQVALNGIIENAVLTGQALSKTKRQIGEFYTAAKGFRSERIARTETAYAATATTEEAYRQTGYVVGKEWLVNPGACEFCQSYAGKTVPLGGEFGAQGTSVTGADGGVYTLDYSSIEGPPLHPNCTCALIPVRG
jgi:HK97 family phage portal protein